MNFCCVASSNKEVSCCEYSLVSKTCLNYVLIFLCGIIVALSVLAVMFLDLGVVNSTLILTGGCFLALLFIMLSSASLVYRGLISFLKKKGETEIEKRERERLAEEAEEREMARLVGW